MTDMTEINGIIDRMRDNNDRTIRHALAHELRFAVSALDAAEGRVTVRTGSLLDDAAAHAMRIPPAPTAPSDKIAEAARVLLDVIAAEYGGADPINISGKWAWGRVRALAGKGE